MLARRQCAHRKENGQACGAAPLRDGQYCLFHDPVHATEAREAQRLGGLRRRREVTVAGAFDFEGLMTVQQIRRLFEVAAFDALGLDNTIARVRALVAVGQAAATLLETGELEERVRVLEQAVLKRDRSVAYDTPSAWDDGFEEEA